MDAVNAGRGDIYFPLQLVIVVSGEFAGGDSPFCDHPERKKSDRRKIPAGLGDAVLFCTRARLMQIAGVYGLKSVKHGMDRITSGTRYAIGISSRAIGISSRIARKQIVAKYPAFPQRRVVSQLPKRLC